MCVSATKFCAVNVKLARSEEGRGPYIGDVGGETKTVVSSVIRSRSHFLRWMSRASCPVDSGCVRRAKADSMSVCVSSKSR